MGTEGLCTGYVVVVPDLALCFPIKVRLRRLVRGYRYPPTRPRGHEQLRNCCYS